MEIPISSRLDKGSGVTGSETGEGNTWSGPTGTEERMNGEQGEQDGR